MPEIHVSSLARLHETVTRTNASHVVTLINAATVVERPAVITPDRHLFIGVSDITAPIDGHIMPSEAHVHMYMCKPTRKLCPNTCACQRSPMHRLLCVYACLQVGTCVFLCLHACMGLWRLRCACVR